MITTVNDFKMFIESNDLNSSKILFLHGLDSRPYEDRLDILRSSGAKVFAPLIDYETDDSSVIADNIIKEEGITHLVGHSIGGILSLYMSNKHRIPSLMFNPAFGSVYRKYISNISKLQRFPVYSDQYAVVGLKDDVVPPHLQLASLDVIDHVFEEENLGHSIPPTIFKKYFDIFCEGTDCS